VTAAGFETKSGYDKGERLNTAYAIDFDGLHVLYLGALGEGTLPADLLELETPDVLIVPVGGEGVLDPAAAQKLAVKLEARIVIPILFDDKSLKQFLKEAGAEGTKSVDKLTIKKKDVADKENEVVVLSA
jgi:L-ascorbate metabolism protein UlaG (beta-lactamase superfamily)